MLTQRSTQLILLLDCIPVILRKFPTSHLISTTATGEQMQSEHVSISVPWEMPVLEHYFFFSKYINLIEPKCNILLNSGPHYSAYAPNMRK